MTMIICSEYITNTALLICYIPGIRKNKTSQVRLRWNDPDPTLILIGGGYGEKLATFSYYGIS